MRTLLQGRYGPDQLSSFIMLLGFILILIALFSPYKLFSLIGAVCVVICYLRIFSKSFTKRYHENKIYMQYAGKVFKAFHYIRKMIVMEIKSLKDKEYKFFICVECQQIIRIPKGKNKISVRCPKCNHQFIKHT